MSLTITQSNFESEVLQSDVPVLIDFWASWCAPCKMAAPIVDNLAQEVGDAAKVGKINVDEEGPLAEQYRVLSIPTMIVFQDGKETARAVGVQDKASLREMLGV